MRLIYFGVCLVVLWGVPGWAGESDGWLISPDEAAMAPATDEGIRSRGLGDAGPGIDIVRPAEGAVVPSPAEIIIKFLPKSGPINLESLKVKLLKFVSIDLTDRLKPFLNTEGIAVKDAKVPGGTYRVRIDLSDTQGKTSTREISFEVK